jgi:uncharacterized protein with FMN-binding domain
MKRTPMVVLATAAGLVGVLAFHTSPSNVSFAPLPGTGSTPQEPAPTGSPSASPTSPSASPASSPTPHPAPNKTRTATGPLVNYSYGVLSVSVTVRGHQLVRVGIATLNDDGSARSQTIDHGAIPILEQQALQAQSANIQGVSGASYTSAGFRTSLQAALRSLGLS